MTEPSPHLSYDAEPADARAAVLVLHGGRSRSTAPVRANQLAVLRMLPFARTLVRVGHGNGLAVARLRYRARGWNGPLQSPVADVEWAMDQLATRFPDRPVALVGHSMGGRAAVYAAGRAGVRSVVGLAPWIEPGDPVDQLAGRRLLFAHGDRDRMTSAPASAEYARAARSVAASVGYVSVHGEKHAMLHRASLWHQLAAGYVLETLCGVPASETVGADAANIVTKALEGAQSLVV